MVISAPRVPAVRSPGTRESKNRNGYRADHNFALFQTENRGFGTNKQRCAIIIPGILLQLQVISHDFIIMRSLA